MRAIALVTILALAACSTPPGSQRLSAGRTVDIASANTQISFQRAGAGIVRPLTHNAALQAAAQAHADDVSRSGSLSHIGSDGSRLAERLVRAGYTACAAAENIAQGQPDIRSTVADWMGSPEHRANILNAQVTQFGFGETGQTRVLVLARPC